MSIQYGDGQWQGKSGSAPEHLRFKVLIIDCPCTPENRVKIAVFCAARKQRTGDQSVLCVSKLASVLF